MTWRQIAAGAVLALAVLAPAQQVFAHAGLVASVPSANAVLETGPPAIQLVGLDQHVQRLAADVHPDDVAVAEQADRATVGGLRRDVPDAQSGGSA